MDKANNHFFQGWDNELHHKNSTNKPAESIAELKTNRLITISNKSFTGKSDSARLVNHNSQSRLSLGNLFQR